MRCLNPVTIERGYDSVDRKPIYSAKRSSSEACADGYLVACGQCIACRINRSRMWSLRCAHEAQQHEESAFITLTYSPEHLPLDLSVSNDEHQRFMKRLRKHVWQTERKKLRFYMAAEYGSPTDFEVANDLSKVGRPHYHYLIFGWYPPDCKPIKKTGAGHVYYTSNIVAKAWQCKGYVVIGHVTPASASYVAGYCTKKICGPSQDEHYTRVHPDTGEQLIVQPEFQRCSQGIGRSWLDSYATDLRKGFLTFDGKTYAIPRYYMKRLDLALQNSSGSDKTQLIELIDDIQNSREFPADFSVIPDFKALQYRYDVAKIYKQRSLERQSLKSL